MNVKIMGLLAFMAMVVGVGAYASMTSYLTPQTTVLSQYGVVGDYCVKTYGPTPFTLVNLTQFYVKEKCLDKNGIVGCQTGDVYGEASGLYLTMQKNMSTPPSKNPINITIEKYITCVKVSKHVFDKSVTNATYYFTMGVRDANTFEQYANAMGTVIVNRASPTLVVSPPRNILPVANVKTPTISAVSTINSCGTISTNGTHLLSNDVEWTAVGRCINVASDNVVFDCQNHVVSANNSRMNYGIWVDGKKNVTIKNCNVNNFSSDIVFWGAANTGMVLNSITTNAYDYGVAVFDSSNIIIKDTVASSQTRTDAAGFLIGGGDLSVNVTLDNVTSQSNYYGIYLIPGSRKIVVKNSVIKDNSRTGILTAVDTPATVTFRNNVIQNNPVGMDISSGSNMVVFDNDFLSNGIGVQIRSKTNAYNNFTQNTFSQNAQRGIYIQDSLKNTFMSNDISSSATCVSLSGASKNSFLNDVLSDCGKDVASMENSTDNVFTNVSLDKANLQYGTGAINDYSVNNLTVQWFARARVTTVRGLPLAGAKVNVSDALTTLVYSNLETGNMGYTQYVVLTEFAGNATNNISSTPHNFTASLNRFAKQSVAQSIVAPTTVWIKLLQAPVTPVLPNVEDASR